MKSSLPTWTGYSDEVCCRDTFEEYQGHVFICVLPPGHKGPHLGANTEWPDGWKRLDAALLGWFDDSTGSGIWEPNVYGYRARRKGGPEDPNPRETSMPLNVHDADIAALAAAIPDPEDQQAMTTPTDLAHRVALLPGFRWMPGMLVTLGERRFRIIFVEDVPREYVPDLTDPATGGCLLTLLGEARRYIRFGFGGQPQWQDLAHSRPAGAWTTVDTLAEACARVALSLGRWPGGEK